MTQQEFEARMEQMNREQEQATLPIRIHIDAIRQKKLEIRARITEMQLQLDHLSMENHREEGRLKELNRDYHQRKHELVLQAPRKSEAM